MNGKTAVAIIIGITLIGCIATWGIVVGLAEGKEAPAGLCTIVGTAVGGLVGALVQLTRKNGATPGPH